jgi:hypothetical protein
VISTLDAPGPVIADATRAILGAANVEDAPRVVMMSSFAVERDRLKGLAKQRVLAGRLVVPAIFAGRSFTRRC